MASLLRGLSRLTIGARVTVPTGVRSINTEFDHSVPRIFDFNVPVSPIVAPTISLTNASSAELVKYQKMLSRHKWQAHATDCGSSAVQIACITDRIRNLARHATEMKKDKSGSRGLTMMVHKREKMMKYLLRSDYPKFVEICNDLGLQREGRQLLRKIKAKRTSGI